MSILAQDLHAMLVRASHQYRLSPSQGVPSLHDIRQDHCIQMSDVRVCIIRVRAKVSRQIGRIIPALT